MAEQERIETSLGPIWVRVEESGELRIWSPPGSPAGDLAATLLRGEAGWHGPSRCWYVPVKKRDRIYAALRDL